MAETINILCVGDVVGKPGRDVLVNHLTQIQKEHDIQFTVVNAENAAGGFGVSYKVYQELGSLPINVLTSGNHIYDKKEIMNQFHTMPKLIRPANFHEDAPGTGVFVTQWNDLKIAVINIIGRVFMHQSECPFRIVKGIVDSLSKDTSIIIVDFHAETTSEKQAMGWYLDGLVSVVFGTHTHVMTADNQILECGTAYITDIGMTGAKDGILGMAKESIIQKFLTQLPAKFEPHNKSDCLMINAIKVTIATRTGKAVSIERLQKEYSPL